MTKKNETPEETPVEETPAEVPADIVYVAETDEGWTAQSTHVFVPVELRYAEAPVPEHEEFGSEAEAEF